MKLKDITGQTFGRLTAIQFFSIEPKSRQARWKCQCICGNTTTIVLGGSLRSGGTISCGCYIKEILKKQQEGTHKMTHSRPFRIWTGMKDRCNNPNSSSYRVYGGRGIRVCQRWNDSFEDFWEDMSPTYDKTLQIDRKDNNANYSPENCRWATNKENSRNKRTNRLLSFNGVTQPVSAWAESMGLSKQAIRHRLEAGMSIKDTLTLPIHKKTDKKMKYDIA